MKLEGTTIGVALTGSFCTYKKVFAQIEALVNMGADVYTIFSDKAQTFNTRFGTAEEFLKKAKELTGHDPILTIPDAEPIGPKSYLDILIIAPCTGNTLAKLAYGMTDSPVLMAAKAHIRNEKPLVLAIATNDALGFNMKNIGLLLNSPNIYFVPFGQDDVVKKPNSLIAHMELIPDVLEMGLDRKQMQPVLREYK
ncbi:MAG: dipicolinate synthase subunit B [bacterium]|nr:dipicolinate synthase subunit B [bacterium]